MAGEIIGKRVRNLCSYAKIAIDASGLFQVLYYIRPAEHESVREVVENASPVRGHR